MHETSPRSLVAFVAFKAGCRDPLSAGCLKRGKTEKHGGLNESQPLYHRLPSGLTPMAYPVRLAVPQCRRTWRTRARWKPERLCTSFCPPCTSLPSLPYHLLNLSGSGPRAPRSHPRQTQSSKGSVSMRTGLKSSQTTHCACMKIHKDSCTVDNADLSGLAPMSVLEALLDRRALWQTRQAEPR